MKERPILFSGAMVRAIFANEKTQTRRTRGLESINLTPNAYTLRDQGVSLDGRWVAHFKCADVICIARCPYGQAGDQLWVRETWMSWPNTAGAELRGEGGDGAIYRATWDKSYAGHQWRTSIHMPRRSSRITLEIADVRVERAQDISEDDARAEGVQLPANTVTMYGSIYRDRFASLWDTINSERGCTWETNPWVWVLVFRRVGQ